MYAGLLLILVAVILVNQTRYLPLESRPHLTTVGTAEVSVTPGEARVYGTFVNQADDQQPANKDNATAVQDIITKLKAIGINKDDIATTNLSVYPEYDYNDYRTSQPKITGYRASATVSVKLKQTDLADKVLAAMTEAKAENVSGPTYTLSEDDLKIYQNEAQAKALVNATTQAESLAVSMNRKLGAVLTITPTSSTGSTPSPLYESRIATAVDSISAGDVAPERSSVGTQTITATVTVVYSLK